MIIITNNTDFAGVYFHITNEWKAPEKLTGKDDPGRIIKGLLPGNHVKWCEVVSETVFDYAILTDIATASQYDFLVKAASQKEGLPGNFICLAGSGQDFHGFHSRSWEALPGNIHLSAYLAPGKKIVHNAMGFLILSAVSVVEAIDDIPGLKNMAKIKWVNDVFIDDAKVSGVLAQVQTKGEIINGAVLGIGVNVESKPEIEPTRFVPAAASLGEYTGKSNELSVRTVFERLLFHLDKNYKMLLEDKYIDLLNIYRDRSLIIGKNAEIWSDDPGKGERLIYTGEVMKIGDDLELTLRGVSRLVISGRLALTEHNSGR